MGADLSRQIFEPQIRDNQNENVLAEEAEFLSYKILDENFDKLYLESRELLQAITENPSDELLKNINRCLNTNSTILKNSFNAAEAHRHEIMSLTTDRLKYKNNDIQTTKTESKIADNYLPTTIKKQQQHP